MSAADLRHHLLAILAADAAAYSRLMALDDGATLRALEAARTVFRAQTSAEGGRVIDTAGDSVLAVFGSAAGAARAALAIQGELALQAQDVAGERLQFRIGLHLGDVIEKADGTVYGDGVNIAARLQALAEPGGIAVSQSIQSAVRGRVTASFVDLGDQAVKNFAEPVRAYRLHAASAAQADPQSGMRLRTRRPAALWAALQRRPVAAASTLALAIGVLSLLGYWNVHRDRERLAVADVARSTSSVAPTSTLPADAGPLSIVVLPFANLIGNAEQAYVADGMTASVTADLSRIRDAFVVSTSTAMAYKQRAVTAQQVGKELGVRFVLQGNVQRSGTKIRINVQLADAESNAQLWSETFEGEASDLFALQDQVTTRIGNSMGRELIVRAARESEKRSNSPTVAILMLRARALQGAPQQSLEKWQQVEALCRQVLSLDPANVAALARLSTSLALQVNNFSADLPPEMRQPKLAEAKAAALRAQSLDHEEPDVYSPLMIVASHEGDWDGQLRASQKLLALRPKSPRSYHNAAVVLYERAEPKPAKALLEKALALDPKSPPASTLFLLSEVEFMLGHYDAAIDWGLQAAAANPHVAARDPFLAMAYALKGDRARAASAVAGVLKASPQFSIHENFLFSNGDPEHPAFAEYRRKVIDPALRLAGFPE